MQQDSPASTTRILEHRGAQSSIDLLELFWRRRALVFSCVLIGIVLGVLYCGLAAPVYESSADVLVVEKRPAVVTGDGQYESGFEDYLATHLAVIVSPLIVERAIEASDLASLDCFADLEDPEEDLVDVIVGKLEVESGSRELGENADSIMTLSFRGSVPEDCPIVVQALLDSYEAFHHEVYHGMSDSTVELISQARDLLENDLAKQDVSYSTFRQESPLIARGSEEINPLQDRLTTIEEQRSELLLRQAEMERQLLALDQAKQDGNDRQQMLAIVSELRHLAARENGLPEVSTALESQLIQLTDDEQRLLEHYGPNHPHVAMIRHRISATRRLFALPTTAHMQSPEPNGDTTAMTNMDPVAVYTRYLNQELNRLKISKELLTDLYDREHDAARKLSIFQLKDERIRRGIDRTEVLYEVVIGRLQGASLVKDFGGFETRVIAPPQLGEKVSPLRRILLPAAAFAGMLLGCMLAVVAEIRDESFSSCEQIRRETGWTVMGQIPPCTTEGESAERSAASDAVLASVLCVYHRPRSVHAEAYRALRTSLFFNGSSETRHVIQVTSASARDGASTVAANLAISVAQTGKSVLLIDANLRHQRQHEMFGVVASDQGLASLVAMDVEPSEVLCKTAVDNLSLLSVGKVTLGPRELFTSIRFGELIDLFRESFDVVLIDTEPLLVASDPCVIASTTDGVLLAMRLTHDSRRRARRAKEIIGRHDLPLLGVVVNRISGAILKRYQRDRHDGGYYDDDDQSQTRADRETISTGI